MESDIFELSIGLVIIYSTITMTLEAAHRILAEPLWNEHAIVATVDCKNPA